MGRRSDVLEAERNFELIKREKQEKGKVIKQTLRFLFSQVGLVFVGVLVAVLGNFLLKILTLHSIFAC